VALVTQKQTCCQVANKEQILIMKTMQMTSDKQHYTWTRVGAERLRLPFSRKPGTNVDSED
jgi:hypothetical protein